MTRSVAGPAGVQRGLPDGAVGAGPEGRIAAAVPVHAQHQAASSGNGASQSRLSPLRARPRRPGPGGGTTGAVVTDRPYRVPPSAPGQASVENRTAVALSSTPGQTRRP